MYKLLKVFSVSLLLSACGNDNNSSAPISTPSPTPEVSSTPEVTPTPEVSAQPQVYTGIFIDAPVHGLSYQTASQSGVTNEFGEFTYQLNEQVVFSIGDITFPEVTASQEITPLTLFNTDEVNNLAVVNTLRFLQSLDSDAMPENGITIPANAGVLADNGNVDFNSQSFENTITPYLVEIAGINQQLISAESAIYHFEATMSDMNPPVGNSCGDEHPMVGYTGSFSTIAHNVSGNATIIDNCTIEITAFNYDGGGPLVYFYGGKDQNFSGSNAFRIGNLLTETTFINETITIKLPNDKTLSDLNSISVWCVDFEVDFGNVVFTAP